jgi:hypothetical protein
LTEQPAETVSHVEFSEWDFLAFARCLVIPSASGPRMMEDAMLDYEQKGVEPFQRNFFEDVAPSLQAVRDGSMPPCRRFWMERTKKASKDSDLAVCVLWLMAFAKRPMFCQIVAASRDQAAIIKRRVEHILFHNEWLEEKVTVQTNRIVGTNGLGETIIEATDNSSAHGGTPDLLILNELVHVAKWKVMETHFNNATGVPRGVMVISTNAGYKGTKAEVWKKNAKKNPERWHMHVWDRVTPWLRREDVQDAEAMNTKSEFVRLFGRKGGGDNWASGKGDALSEDSIDRVFRPELKPMKGWVEGWDFLAGLDLGVSHDHAGLAVVGVNREQKRMRVAHLKDWAPSVRNSEGKKIVDVSSIRKTVVHVYKRFRIAWFGYDPAAGGHIVEQDVKRQGVWMRAVPFTGASWTQMAIAYMQVMEAGVLECFENEALRRDLGKFSIEARPPSGYRLTAISDAFGHADVGTALVMLLPKAIVLMGGLPSDHSGLLVDESSEYGEEEPEITDPALLDILDEGGSSEERSFDEMMRERRVAKDPFGDLF